MFIERFILVIIVYILFYLISYKIEIDTENIRSYECGFDPKSITRLIFSYRFFLITILFLIFDVEISLILPVPYILRKLFGNFLFYLFILIIILGLFYEYYYGRLNWLN